MKLVVWFTVLIALLSLPALAQSSETGVVTHIVDGDTIDVRLASGEVERVRYIGMDTPELTDDCYAEAKALNAALVDGQTVTLVRDVSETDRFGRLLRYVFIGDVFVNAELVRQGYAEAADYPPDTAQSALLHELQGEAESGGYGCLNDGLIAPDAPASAGAGALAAAYYVTGSSINVRACERTSCARVAVLPWGSAVAVLDTVVGEAVSGSTRWYEVRMADGAEGFIHSSLLTAGIAPTPRPAAVNAPAPAANSGGQAISTPVPAPVSTPAPAPGFACNCSRTCGQMTCEEAYFQLQQCGCSERDSDHDGYPCESQCGG